VQVKSQDDASKNRRDRAQALALARSAAKIVVGKGKKAITFDMKKEPPDDEVLLAHLLGPTGNLRAPTVKIGDTLLVGFNEETYEQYFGS
jgi:hypothetical protein